MWIVDWQKNFKRALSAVQLYSCEEKDEKIANLNVWEIENDWIKLTVLRLLYIYVSATEVQ
jgi:uncharacterized protein YhbP (UPF0306 family)